MYFICNIAIMKNINFMGIIPMSFQDTGSGCGQYEGLVISSRKLQKGRLTDFFSNFLYEAHLFIIPNRGKFQILANYSF